MAQPGVAGDWSVKDMLAHIAWYEREEADVYGEVSGEGSPLWNVPQEPRNRILFEQARGRPLEEVLADFREAHERFLGVIERLSEEDLARPGRFPGTSPEWPPWRKIAVHSCDHDQEHIDMIRAWLGRESPERGCLQYRQSLDEQLPDAPRSDAPYRP